MRLLKIFLVVFFLAPVMVCGADLSNMAADGNGTDAVEDPTVPTTDDHTVTDNHAVDDHSVVDDHHVTTDTTTTTTTTDDHTTTTTTTTDEDTSSIVIDVSGDGAMVFMGDGSVQWVEPDQVVMECPSSVFSDTSMVLEAMNVDIVIEGTTTHYSRILFFLFDGGFVPVWFEQE